MFDAPNASYLEQGMNLVRRLQSGELYKYRFHFTHDVNRESVQQKLTDYLKNNAFQGVRLELENDRSFILFALAKQPMIEYRLLVNSGHAYYANGKR